MSNNSGNGNGRSPTDIITYIGVPLAVLGVLPILYNTFVTLASLSRIKRMLRHGRLTALTRSDVVNRVIEIELPRYAVMPFDRFQDRDEYWTLSRTPSNIPGGSWTTFNWKTNTIGVKTQRVEYADQVRQPQVDVAFDELICYLLDLGAVPDAQGWKLLRSAGMWAPVGCSLMRSPDGKEKALTIAPLHDSDGNMSLTVAWSSTWITRDHAHLPPYWVSLPCPPSKRKTVNRAHEEAEQTGEKPTKHLIENNDEVKKAGETREEETEPEAGESSSAGASLNGDSIDEQGRSNAASDLTCQFGIDGLKTALVADVEHPINVPQCLYIDHLRVTSSRSNGMWFASAATAYGTSSQTVLWNYKIPDHILAFSRRSTVPCGVLVLLEMVDESDTPEWATKHDDAGLASQMHRRRADERHEAFLAETKMSPEARKQAKLSRFRQESRQMVIDMQDRQHLEAQRLEQRTREALQSPNWDNRRVAECTLSWLHREKVWADHLSAKSIVGFILHRMVLDGAFATSICQILDVWRAWSDMSGMKKADLITLREQKAIFAQASLLIALMKDTGDELEGTLATDLQECLRIWRTVRLG